jgi:hypothetical protein
MSCLIEAFRFNPIPHISIPKMPSVCKAALQSIITDVKKFLHWDVLYTNVPRQNGTEAMKDYEKRIGLELSSTNAFVNLLLSSEADYFVLTMGSSWSLLIDSLRSTNGRLRRGVLSVNRDRRWY